MKHHLIIITERIERRKCKTHNKTATVKVVEHNIHLSCCCEEFQKHLERKIEHVSFMELSKEGDEFW